MESSDANTYRSFKVLDSIIMKSIKDELDGLGEPDEEGAPVSLYRRNRDRCTYLAEPIGLVGAVTKALCCAYVVHLSW